MKRIWNLALGTAVLCAALLCGCTFNGSTAPAGSAPADPLTGQELQYPGERGAAVVIDNAPAKEFVAANPGLVLLDTSYAEEDYAIGMAKGSALEDAVNKALEELKADGTLQAIVDKYITAE